MAFWRRRGAGGGGLAAVTLAVVWCSAVMLATASAEVEKAGNRVPGLQSAAARQAGTQAVNILHRRRQNAAATREGGGGGAQRSDEDAEEKEYMSDEDIRRANEDYVDALVDADTLLAPEDAERIRHELLLLRRGDDKYGIVRGCGQGIAAAVVLLQGAPREYIGVDHDGNHGDDDAVRRAQTTAGAAKLLHDTWGLGSDACGGNGMLILVSVDERAVEFSTGRTASQLLPDAFLQRVVDAMKPSLRRENFAEALLLALRACGRYATGEREEVARVLLDATRVARRGTAENAYDFFSQIISIGILFLAQLTFAAIQNSIGAPRRRREQSRWFRCMKLLKDIERSADDTARGVDTAGAKHSPNHAMNICAICLESFDDEKEDSDNDDDANDDDGEAKQRQGEEQRPPYGTAASAEAEATATVTVTPTPTSRGRRGFFELLEERLVEFACNLKAHVCRWMSRMYRTLRAYIGGDDGTGNIASSTGEHSKTTVCDVGKPEIVRINLECGHSFCRSCLSKWFKSRTTCPLCREECHVRLRRTATSATATTCETASPSVDHDGAATMASDAADANENGGADASTEQQQGDAAADRDGGLFGRFARYMHTLIYGSDDVDEGPASFAEQRRVDTSAFVRDIAHDADGFDVVAGDAARETGRNLRMYCFGLRRLQRMYPTFIDDGMINSLTPTQRLSREVSFLNRYPQRQTMMTSNNNNGFHSSSSFSAFGGGSSRAGGGASGRW